MREAEILFEDSGREQRMGRLDQLERLPLPPPFYR